VKRPVRMTATLLLVLHLAGCVTWQPVSTAPDRVVSEEQPDRVRVTRMDGMELLLEAPAVRAGAIVATASPGAVLVGDVRSMEVERISVARSIALALPGVVILAVVGKAACRC